MKALLLLLLALPAAAQVTGGTSPLTAAPTLSSLGAASSGANTNLTSASALATVSTPAGLTVTYDVRAASGAVGGVTAPANLSVTLSSSVFVGVQIATQAAGAAGAAVTAVCPANTYVMYGGCNCTGTAVGTSTIIFNGPAGTWTAAGPVQTGWKCQAADVTTGQTCAAFVQCASIRNTQ